MKRTALLVVLLTAGSAPAQPAVQVWAKQIGTPADDNVAAAAPDGADGLVICGDTLGNLGAPNMGVSDAFIARYDGAGNQVWLTQFGTIAADDARDVAHLGAGGSVLVGSTAGNLGGLNMGASDGYVAFVNAAGNVVYINQFGTPGSDIPKGVAVNGTDAMVVGNTTGNLGGPSAGGADAFLMRFDVAANNLVWISQIGTAATENAAGVAFDGVGGVYIGGLTYGSLGAANAGGSDAFVARYNAAGNLLWIRQFGTPASDIAGHVAPDGAGGVLFMGYTYGNLVGVNAGGADVFLARYDPAGNQLWLRQFGSAGAEYGSALRPIGAGEALFTGVTDGALWGPALGMQDALLARFDAVGNQFLWGIQFGTPGDDTASGLVTDGADAIFVAGDTTGNLAAPNAGGSDIYVTRFTGCYPDCNGDGALDVSDFGCYTNKFITGSPYADCNADGVIDIADFGCYVNKFIVGCP